MDPVLFFFLWFVGSVRPTLANTATHDCTVTRPTDVAILVQLSDARDPEVIDDMKTFILLTFERFLIDPDHTKVALMQYSQGPRVIFDFNRLRNEAEFQDEVYRFEVSSLGGNDTADAVIFAIVHFWTPKFGARTNNPDVQKMLVVMADSPVIPQPQLDLINVALNVSKIDIHVVCVTKCDEVASIYETRTSSTSAGPLSKKGDAYISTSLADRLTAKLSCDFCYPDPCNGRGKCLQGNGGYTCTCSDEFTGSECEDILSNSFCDANSEICRNGGTCIDGPRDSSYKCVCGNFCYGFHCEKCDYPENDQTVCQPNPCVGDCNCIPSCQHELGYFCRSPGGYLGKNCSIRGPEVDCQNDMIVVAVSRDFVEDFSQGIDNSFVYLSPDGNDPVPSECKARETSQGEHVLSISLPFQSCSTEMAVDSDDTGDIVVSNRVWIGRELSGGLSMPVPVVSFACRYEEDYQLVTSLRSSLFENHLHVTKQGVYDTDVQLCKVERSCTTSCPAEYLVREKASYTVGEMIHVKLRVLRGKDGSSSKLSIAILERAWLSCGAKDDVMQMLLVEEGCRTLVLPTNIGVNELSNTVCLSFQTPRPKNCRVFYIYAQLKVVPRSYVKRCNDGHGFQHNATNAIAERRRRSYSVEETKVGPIFVLPNAPEKVVRVFPASPEHPDNNRSRDKLPWWPPLAVLIILLLVLMVGFAIYTLVKRLR
ncbi:uncharacterized protein LOC143460766 isoform X1 [Clavelina lepadiformis]|uniref:uncharacterized protein LOC143460766 isoform X1 n=1 Tax=Clavelina lepadiformis TaxID=159417 RepID=UPI0040424E48